MSYSIIGFGAGGRFAATGAPPNALIQVAYGVKDFQISGGPKWVGTERYDVVAKRAADGLSQQQLKAMLRTLLADRFKLKIHRETKEMPMYMLPWASAFCVIPIYRGASLFFVCWRSTALVRIFS